MKNFITPSRYAFFALFLICNAVVCAAAVWNFGISQSLGRALGADAYLAVLSAASLVFLCFLAVMESMRRDIVTTHVWFECIWVGVICLLDLGGAITITALGPQALCDAKMAAKANSACDSTRVVMAFIWLCTLISLAYVLALSICAFMCSRDDPTVWDASVRHYRWQDMSRELAGTPTLSRFASKDSLSIKAPRPRHLAPKELFLTSEPKKEFFQSSINAADRPVPPVPLAPSARAPQSTRQQVLLREIQAASLYPSHMDAYAPTPPPKSSKPVAEAPPPLGTWPRAKVPTESSRAKRKEVPPIRESILAEASTSQAPAAAVPIPRHSGSGSISSTYVPRRSASISSIHAPKQVSPIKKTKGGSGDWRDRVVVPPPLDLSKISNTRPRN